MTEVPLSEACKVNPPKPHLNPLPDDTGVLFVPMAAVDEVSGTVTSPEIRKLGDLRSKSYRCFQAGDVIFAKITPCMENGKSAVVPESASGVAFGSTEFHVLRPNAGVDARYIWHFVRRESFRQRAREAMTGSVGQERVPASFVANVTIPLPSTEVQRQIADYLDSALASGRSATMHLVAARSASTRFRRALLTAAADGRLTANWRLQQGRVDEDNLPASWTRTTIAEVAECLDRRRRPVNAVDRAHRHGQVPYYGANGQVGVIDEALFDEELVLVVEDETFTGRVRPFSYVINGPSWVNNHAHVLRARESVCAELLNILLSHYDFVPLTSGTTGRRKLNQAALMSAPILVPPPDEQSEIVSRVRSMSASDDAIRARTEVVDRRVRQSCEAVLARAFTSAARGLTE